MTSAPVTRFGKLLLRLREKSGLSSDQLARQLGVSRETVSAWELERTMPSEHHLLEIARVFDVHPLYLAGRRAAKSPLEGEAAARIMAETRRQIAELLGLEETEFSLEPRLVDPAKGEPRGLTYRSGAGARGVRQQVHEVRHALGGAGEAMVLIDLDRGARALRVDDLAIRLSPTEFLIVERLVTRAADGVKRRDLLEALYGAETLDARHELRLSAYVSRLRSALRRVTGRADLIQRTPSGAWTISNSERPTRPAARPVRWAALERQISS